MAVRAVTTVMDSTGRPRRLWAAWASPEYQIPHLAEFLTWADDSDLPLTIASYLTYASDHPGTLPVEDVTDTVDDDEPGDLDYRYQLTLAEETRSLRLVVRHMKAEGRIVATVGRANLYATAADMCDLLAQRSAAYTESRDGAVLPDGDPDTWRRAAAEFRQRHQSSAVAAAAANLAAQFTPADHLEPYPSITVAGMLGLAYVDHTGTVRVSVHLDEVADWLVRPDGTVPIRIVVNDTEVFRG